MKPEKIHDDWCSKYTRCHCKYRDCSLKVDECMAWVVERLEDIR